MERRYEKYFFWCAGMRRLIVRECGIGTDGPALSDTSGHANSAVRRWRAPRYADAHCERANARLARPTPMTPDAPVIFSISIGWPSETRIRSLTMRVSVSRGPPAPYGTISVTGRVG